MANPPPVSDVTIRLTASAEAYAGKHGLTKAIAAAVIGPEAAVGDVVSFEDRGEHHDFAIVGRRWLVSEDRTSLELTFDHPVRRGR